MYANTQNQIVPGTASRGTVAAVNDKVTYAKELLDANLNVSYATNVYNNVYVLRTGLNNVNFDVVKYEQMASAGRSAEALINVDLYRDYYYTPEGGEKRLYSALLILRKMMLLKHTIPPIMQTAASEISKPLLITARLS